MEGVGIKHMLIVGLKVATDKNSKFIRILIEIPNKYVTDNITCEITRVASLPRQQPENVRHSCIGSIMFACMI
jgi:hypothetical protein